MEWNSKIFSRYEALLNSRPFMLFTIEEINGCNNEVATCTNKASRNMPSCSFISCFTVSVTPSTNTPESSNYFMILIISFISSFIYHLYIFNK